MMNEAADNAPRNEDLNSDPDRILDALEDVLTEFDEYVAAWFDRLDHTLAACESLPAPASEVVSCEGEKGLREKTDQLTAAWLRLEAEQRKFLQMSANYPNATRDLKSVSDAVEDELSEEPPQPIEQPAAPRQIQKAKPQPVQGQSSRQSPGANLRPSRDAACQQFQRLKRQIRSNRPKSS